MTITPDQARELLYGTTPGPWEMVYEEWENPEGIPCESWTVCDKSDGLMDATDFDAATHDPAANTALAAAAPDLAQTVIEQAKRIEELEAQRARMNEEWGVEADGNALFPVNEEWHPSGEYFTESRADAEAVRDRMGKLNPHVHYRLVRRLVGPVEVIDSE